jgi:DNA-binding beta-propeller fold protein YncE
MISRWRWVGVAALVVMTPAAGCQKKSLLACQPGAVMAADGSCLAGLGGGGGAASSSSASSSSGAGGNTGCDDPQVAQGALPIDGTEALVPLCGGRVLLGNTTKNQVELRDVTGQTPPQTWPLPAAPGAIVHDAAADVVYVAQHGTNQLAQIALSGTAVTQIPLSAPAVNLAMGSGGTVFAVLHDVAASATSVVAIDAAGLSTSLALAAEPYGGLLAFDAASSKLFIADAGLSPSSLSRYAWDPATKAVTLEQARQDAGTNGQGLSLSPDGAHLAFPCGGGNAGGYVISDYDPQNFDTAAGAWDTGAYPRAAAFSPDSAQVLATNGTDVQLFDVATHKQLQSTTPTGTGCAELNRVAVSPGGRILYAVSLCSGATTSGRLFWWTH